MQADRADTDVSREPAADQMPPLMAAVGSDEASGHHLTLSQLTSFVGRQHEILEVGRLLTMHRLVSLTGAPGVGKTRLALRVAGEIAKHFPDGVTTIELAPLADPHFVPLVVARAIGVRDSPSQPTVAAIAEAVGTRLTLLLLDNCEHLIEACAELVERLMHACPGLTILTTSREPLMVNGETVVRVSPLSLPDGVPPHDVDALLASEAIRLFVERGRSARSDFALTAENGAAVIAICRHLDGIPLAIEMAAAHLRGLAAEQLAERLIGRLPRLTAVSRTVLSRHRTLHELIAWSDALLTGPERALLWQLAVFAGGFNLEAVETVCGGQHGDEPPVLDRLLRLIDKSLVVMEERDGQARYRLLEITRQYAAERLRASGAELACRERHRDWVLALAKSAAPKLLGPEQAIWLRRLEADHDNIRAALALSLVHPPDDAENALGLVAALYRFWWRAGHRSEGRTWIERALSRAGAARSPAFARALNGAGALARAQGDYAVAWWSFETSLSIFRELGDERGIANALHNLASIARHRGEHAQASMLLEESLAAWRTLGDDWGIATALGHQARVAQGLGDYPRAVRLWQDSLTRFRALGESMEVAVALSMLGRIAIAQDELAQAAVQFDESLRLFGELENRAGVANALTGLGRVAVRTGQYARARQILQESLVVSRELADREGIAECLAQLAAVAAATGQPVLSVRLFGAVDAVREALGGSFSTISQVDLEHDLSVARSELAGDIFEATWRDGRALPAQVAIEEALSLQVPDPAAAPPPGGSLSSHLLTAREREVARLIARGLTNRQIADELVIAVRTAHAHVGNILGKLGFSSRSQIAIWALDHGLLARPSAQE